LLMEVDHRAKNALAVVTSIVRLSRADDAARYADSITKRVQVLANAHSLLAQRGWREIPLRDLVRDQMRGVDASRVAFDGDRVMISALMVQPIALVLHELLDNAVRHGALAAPSGKLDVSWTGTGSYGGFDLQWRENGGRDRSSDSRAGFGGVLIAGLVERQLNGQIERHWTGDGLAVVIRLPGEIQSGGPT
jgi:two-component sensor histidine kinase